MADMQTLLHFQYGKLLGSNPAIFPGYKLPNFLKVMDGKQAVKKRIRQNLIALKKNQHKSSRSPSTHNNCNYKKRSKYKQ